MVDITCEKCGDTRENVPRNTKFCKKCRIEKDAAHFTEDGKVCRSSDCGRVFCPTEKHDHHCPACHTIVADARGWTCDCILCHRAGAPQRWKGIPVCTTCAGSADKRHALLRAFAKGREQRHAANSPFKPGPIENTYRPRGYNTRERYERTLAKREAEKQAALAAGHYWDDERHCALVAI